MATPQMTMNQNETGVEFDGGLFDGAITTMSSPASMTWSVAAAWGLMLGMVLWIGFLMYDARTRPKNRPSVLATVALAFHIIPPVFLLRTTIIADKAHDPALVWFLALLAFRYWRTIVNIFFWFRYKPAVTSSDPNVRKVRASHCTVIVPTVGPKGNPVFEEMVTAILVNQPRRLIFAANTAAAEREVSIALEAILKKAKEGETAYQRQHDLGPLKAPPEYWVFSANVSNKREQLVEAFDKAYTDIVAMADDTAIWPPKFLEASLPAFESKKVGMVGTRKWVKRLSRPYDPAASLVANLWSQYVAGFWNTMGGLYLVRHNFEIRATNAADGGVFCVSGRSSLLRTKIVKNEQFKDAFLNEYICRRFGPMKVDDDNFMTRWVLNHGWEVKIQYSQEATMTTVLGAYPLKFPEQCKRWSRTTFRQNPIALFIDRLIWSKWQLTVWTTYLPWLYNAALFWDGLAVYTLTQTTFYAESSHSVALLCGLIGFIWATKLVKTIEWFWEYPVDFFLYFVIPAYPLFAYWHSLLKVYTALTFWDITWCGRKLEQTKEVDGDQQESSKYPLDKDSRAPLPRRKRDGLSPLLDKF